MNPTKEDVIHFLKVVDDLYDEGVIGEEIKNLVHSNLDVLTI